MTLKINYDFEEGKEVTEKVIVMFHGWNGNRNSMRPIFNLLNISNLGCYLLEAPYDVQNSNNGYSWSYEITKGVWEVDEPRTILNAFFDDIFNKHESKDIFVMGFSQGGLICLEYGLFLQKTLGGFFSIGGFLRNPKAKIERYNPIQKHAPILLAHGKDDDVVPVQSSIDAYTQLNDQDANVELLLYNGKHKIGIECLRRIKEIILN